MVDSNLKAVIDRIIEKWDFSLKPDALKDELIPLISLAYSAAEVEYLDISLRTKYQYATLVLDTLDQVLEGSRQWEELDRLTAPDSSRSTGLDVDYQRVIDTVIQKATLLNIQGIARSLFFITNAGQYGAKEDEYLRLKLREKKEQLLSKVREASTSLEIAVQTPQIREELEGPTLIQGLYYQVIGTRERYQIKIENGPSIIIQGDHNPLGNEHTKEFWKRFFYGDVEGNAAQILNKLKQGTKNREELYEGDRLFKGDGLSMSSNGIFALLDYMKDSKPVYIGIPDFIKNGAGVNRNIVKQKLDRSFPKKRDLLINIGGEGASSLFIYHKDTYQSILAELKRIP